MEPFISADAINAFFVHNPIFTISVGISALVATIVYLLSFSDVIRKEIKRRRMKHRINSMRDHYIICGFGRVGQQVARELSSNGELFVILEREESMVDLAKEHNWAYCVGDVALEEALFKTAQIDKAKAVIIAVGSDADAIFMAISARALKKDIFIVARASSPDAADKLTKIGVNRVALPYQIGGYHMATMALHPSVVDFLDLLIDHERDELEMEGYHIATDGPFVGKSIKETPIAKDGLAVLAIRRKNGKAIISPEDSTKLEADDRLVVMGSQAKLTALSNEIEKKQHGKGVESDNDERATVVDVQPGPFLKE